ncbi:MAG: ankyrin repeat domain-containing protein, partial [Rickettsiaceae bacterium]|nr:ankyrin repeat domain-containing protein [Rickettsiaceae bacterium]
LTPLYDACLNGHTKTAEFLIKECGVNPNFSDNAGRTLLHIACLNGHTKTAEFLITMYEANVNLPNSTGRTPLHLACAKGHTEVLDLLMKHGANVDQSDKNGMTALHIAYAKGDTEIAKLLIETYGANPNLPDNNGLTPLYDACLNGHTKTAEFLIKECGVNPNFSDNAGRTLLHIACAKGHTEVVDLLMKLGANLYRLNNKERTPLDVACVNGHTEVVDLLIKKYLVDVNQYHSTDCWTPLHYACANGRTEIAKLLIDQHKAKVNKAAKNGQTPLHVACDKGHTKVVDLLMKHGALHRPNTKDFWTPFHLACANGHTEVVDLLISKYHVDLNQQHHRNGFTSLNIACTNGHTKVAKLLISYGANVNLPNSNGFTSLNIACADGHTEVVKLLIEHGTTSDVTAVISETIPEHYIVAQQWCKNAFKETPEYGSLHLLSEEARNVIKTIVANKFIDNDFTSAEINDFFAQHKVLQYVQAEIIGKVANDDVYIYKQANKIAEYLSGEAGEEPDLGNIQLPAEKLADNIIKYLKLHRVSSYHELADRTLHLNNCDYAKEEIQTAIADEITKGAHLEKDLRKCINGKKNQNISYFNSVFEAYEEDKSILEVLDSLKAEGYKFSDFVKLISDPKKLTSTDDLTNFYDMPKHEKVLKAAIWEHVGEDFPKKLTNKNISFLNGGIQKVLTDLEDYVLPKNGLKFFRCYNNINNPENCAVIPEIPEQPEAKRRKIEPVVDNNIITDYPEGNPLGTVGDATHNDTQDMEY